jgi:nitrate reductase delta subunit
MAESRGLAHCASRPPRRPGPSLSDQQLGMAWHAASLLLGYPDAALLGQLEAVHRASHPLPDAVGGPLRATVVHLERAPLTQLQEEFVATFGSRRPSLSLARLQEAVDGRHPTAPLLAEAGDPVDHVSVVLEYAATVDRDFGGTVLRENRAGLGLLLAFLKAAESGWVGAVGSVLATLPPLDREQWGAIRRVTAERRLAEVAGLAG